jgi:hypothetical protein
VTIRPTSTIGKGEASALLKVADSAMPVFVPKADVSNRSKAGFSIAELIEPERAI